MSKTVKHLARLALNTAGVKDVNYSVKHRIFGQPYAWSDFPSVIQLDLDNRCGPKVCGLMCCYCRPQRDVLKGLKQHQEMSNEVLDWVLKDVAKYGRGMDYVADFLDGDGLNSSLPEKRRVIKKAVPWVKLQTFTCGTRPENAQYLCESSLDWICVTLSAHSDEVYRKVHASTRFNDVLKTMRYISEHHLPHQVLEVHYVVNKYNINYIADWLKLVRSEFPLWVPKISPLVNTGSDDESNNACGDYTTLDQENAIKQAGGESFWDRRDIGARQPCVLWHNASVTANGDLLQCCRWDKMDWSYGKAQDYIKNGWGFRDYWMQKILNRQRNVFCGRCNLKVPNSELIASKIDVRGVIAP